MKPIQQDGFRVFRRRERGQVVMHWTHRVCEACWVKAKPGREPFKLKPEYETAGPCCGCGQPTRDGIYMRADPGAMACKGQGPEHEDSEA